LNILGFDDKNKEIEEIRARIGIASSDPGEIG
jgi:hypothetical protein